MLDALDERIQTLSQEAQVVVQELEKLKNAENEYANRLSYLSAAIAELDRLKRDITTKKEDNDETTNTTES